jgi:hypothetical protein
VEGALVVHDEALARRLGDYGDYLRSIGQAQVQRTIANTFASMKEAGLPSRP